jgi:phage baseplate assembly protein W
MPILDTSKRPQIVDRDELVFIGIDLPFRKSDGPEGWFASTSYSIDAVKQNVKLLLQTRKGERLMQPNLGLDLHKFLFEPFTADLVLNIENDIVETFNIWLPFVTIQDISIEMNDSTSDVNNNTLSITIVFNLTQDPLMLASVTTNITADGAEVTDNPTTTTINDNIIDNTGV